MKLLITFTIVALLSGCTSKLSSSGGAVRIITGAKCPPTPSLEKCPPGAEVIEAFIEVDAKGAPQSVNTIVSCAGKKVKWTYRDPHADGEAPPFLVIFDPAVYPGQSYDVLSKPRDRGENQEFTLNTRILRGAGDEECLNYDIMIPGKGLLDPVFIIKR